MVHHPLGYPRTMTTPGSGVVRVVRAGVLSGLVILLTAGAHRLGGGSTPGVFALCVLVLALWPAALMATGRRLRPVGLLAGLGAGQALGHVVLGWLGGSGSVAAVSAECLQHATHLRPSQTCLEPGLAAAAPVVTAHGHTAIDSGPVMLAAHVLATVVAALLVARGEQVLWRVLDLVLRALPVLVRPVAHRPQSPVLALLVPERSRVDVRAPRGPPALTH